jgi:hypothetical protein
MRKNHKSPLSPLYERGARQKARQLPLFIKGDGRGILGNFSISPGKFYGFRLSPE